MQYNITLQNSELAERISELIHSERDRRIMHLRLVDGLTYEQIAESVDMSAWHVKRIVKKSLGIIIPEQKVFTEICFS